MVLLICIIVWLIGIPISFLLMGGHQDFVADPEEDRAEKEERYFSIVASLAMAMMWPLFWALVLLIYVIGHIVPRMLS